MNDGQKYDGKENLATNLEQTAQNPDLSATADPQTANSDTPAASSAELSFTFDDLLQTEGLTNGGKILLEGLQAADFSLPTLKRAAEFMAKTTDSSAPSDEFNGVSLKSILNEELDLKKGADTPLKKFMSRTDLSPTNHAILTQLSRSGADDDLVIKTGERLIQFYPTQIPTKAKFFSPTKADLPYKLSISTHSRGGASTADIIAFALEEYSRDRMEKAFNDTRNGDFQNAFINFQDSQTATSVLFEMLLEANDLAEKNYWASHGEEQNSYKDKSSYKRWLVDYMQVDPNAREHNS